MRSDYRPALWDDTDPEYSPGRKRIRSNFYWVPPKKYKDAGYAVKSVNLGKIAEVDELTVARKCRDLTREMVRWYEGEEAQRIKVGTWGYVIQHYLTAPASAVWDVQPQTRDGYVRVLSKIQDAIKDVEVGETDYPMLVEWRRNMQENGRSVHYIKNWFTHFRIAVSHGIKYRIEGCDDVSAILRQMRFQSAARRTQYATREQIYQVVDECDRRGLSYMSLQLMLRFELLLRGVDVIGQWVTASSAKAGGISYGERVWQDGLTWDMFAPDLASFSKVISKTRKTLADPYTFDLTGLPKIRERLLAIPMEERIGPVIKLPDGRPPTRKGLAKNWRRICKDLRLPAELQMRDARSGGITEAKSMVDIHTLRDAAQHTQSGTTEIYARGRSEGANRVVALRQKKNDT